MVAIDIVVATHTAETVAAIHAALDARRPLALLHAKLPAGELARQRAAVEAASFTPEDAFVLFTSGSTGSARGVVLSRGGIEAAARATWEHLGRHDGDRWLCCLPLAHAGGLSIVVRCRIAGVDCVLAGPERARVRARDACTCTCTSTCTCDATLLSLVPAQLATLLGDPQWRPPPTLRAVLLGGAAAPPSLIAAALARDVPVLPTYGLTETFGQVATARTPGGPLAPLPGIELDAGTRAAPAPIRIRGPQLASRYLDGTPIAPELVTADLGFIEDGALVVVGRADDVIISGGENVHPAQVEAVLASTPGVCDSIAFGVPDPHWGQLVAVALAIDASFDHARAAAYWRTRLPPHARPRRLAIAGELPRLASGKPDRRRAATLPTSPIDYA